MINTKTINILDSLSLTLEEMELIVFSISDSQPQPLFSIERELLNHKEEEKTEELAIFLKLRLLVHSLRTVINLLKIGEPCGPLLFCRLIHETIEDITFFYLVSEIKDGESDTYPNLKEKALNFFYEKSNNHARRKDIQKAIVDLMKNNEASQENLYALYCKFVHPNYQIITDLFYSRDQKKYTIEPNSLLAASEYFSATSLPYIFYHSLVALQLACHLLKKYDFKEKIFFLGQKFIKKWGISIYKERIYQKPEDHYSIKIEK